ncbi:hypothetical protein GH714_021735 [Hevea brasiliensis]|uniref:Uncharacterized protein n=1 Tax=Hevea brasiliensis TaxID=3981 RepID=A0A6A6MNV4_HEVBR|nr:hypothetical protein GH714_021735 [Hevea brasiliensis]
MPPIARISKPYVPNLLLQTESASEEEDKKSHFDEEDRPNIRAGSVPRPRAVLSSPASIIHRSYAIEPLSSVAVSWRVPRVSAAVAQEEAAATAPVEEGLHQDEQEHRRSAQLAGIIQDYGTPELVEVLYDRETGRSRGFAFVTMSSVEDCNAVIENLDGSVRTIPSSVSVTSESLTQAFQEYGNVVGARVLYDGETGRSRGYGFVCYSTRSEMENALESLNGVQIHALIMTLNYAGIEIRTAHSLESWNGGVLVMVSGSVQVKDFSGRRKFVETFFLAPQEKGYFVLNDVFHFIDEEQIHHYPAVLRDQNNLESKLNAPTAIPEPDEIRSVYVRNLPTTVSEAEIEEEFKNFGKIAPDGVVIRSRKDVGVCYAFVEFEDMTGVHNAVKEGSAHVAGWQVYIEERRPNSNIPSRAGRGRGRGRGNYPTDAPRGRFGGRSFDRGDRDYSRSRGNGYYRPNPRQDRGLTGYQLSRNGQNQSE